MKIISSITIWGLILSSLMSLSNPAGAKNDMGDNIHIDQSRQFPETRWANADHFIRVHVPNKAKALKILRLRVPENLRFAASQVEVLSVDGKKIPATITSVNADGSFIQIEFVRPISKNTLFEVHIQNVAKISMSRPSTYTLSAQLVDGTKDEPVGEAYFRSY
jgi:Protein of unknown function (DUF2808)